MIKRTVRSLTRDCHTAHVYHRIVSTVIIVVVSICWNTPDKTCQCAFDEANENEPIPPIYILYVASIFLCRLLDSTP